MKLKEELEKIGIELACWCKKHNKNYASMAYVDGVIMANIGTEDKNYEETRVYINEEGVEKRCLKEN